MPRKCSWTDAELKEAVKNSKSYRAVLIKLNLVPAGGNYVQIRYRIINLGISTEHFTGKGWRKDSTRPVVLALPIEELLITGSRVQSYKLKIKLFATGLKAPECELCGWCEKSIDGRIPLELDHINGERQDNRLENLRVLCPNCHSLQPTHRGKNKKVALRNRIK